MIPFETGALSSTTLRTAHYSAMEAARRVLWRLLDAGGLSRELGVVIRVAR